jgi:hypothetical protein
MPKFQKLLTMNRQGEFEIYTTGDSHCGTLTDQYLPVKYHMVCECENVLDSRGFLFEQVNVDKFFKSLRSKSTKLSCEKLTIACCKQLVSLIKKDNPVCKVRSIKLTLSPHPFQASMTYSVEPIKETVSDGPKRKQTGKRIQENTQLDEVVARDPAYVAW